VTHVVEEMSTDNFITTTRAALALENNPNLDLHILATKETICRSVPSLTLEQLGGLPLRKLQLIAAFVRGEDGPEVVDTEISLRPDVPATAEPGSDEGKATAGK